MTQLGRLGTKFFEQRKIDEEVAVRYGIYTGKAGPGGKVEPSESGNVLVFPYRERDAVVNEKYRGAGKIFWQREGGRRTFWNSDALDDPTLLRKGKDGSITGSNALIITEGELDALTAIHCGHALVVSVPDGAPSELSKDADAREEQSGKFMFLYNNRERLKPLQRFILAVDNDEPGQVLAAELVRRLSAGRCSFVEYPEGCKDLNDVLMKHGEVAVTQVLLAAKPYPVHGLYRLSDYPDLPAVVTYSTGWKTLDKDKPGSPYLEVFPGEFMVVTGIPGHGKSSWVMNLLANLADAHGWRCAVFSPEMPVTPHLRNKLRAIHARSQSETLDATQIKAADDWIEEHFLFLDADPSGAWDAPDKTLGWLEETAAEAVMRDGVRVLVVDPWNELEHERARGESTTEYIGRGIRTLRHFAQRHHVVVIVVAHPTKEIGKETREPGLYDIDGSAHWANKPDHGVTVYRPNGDMPETEIYVKKARFTGTGARGKVTLRYDLDAERYYLLDHGKAKDADSF